MVTAGKVDRKMQGRLQSGGAVLWFLRKHAPMPTPFSSLTPMESFGGAIDEVAQPQADVPPRPNTSMGFVLDNPQQQFLHSAVKCIGTELEEMHPSAAPLIRVRGGVTNAHKNRQALKYAFAKHSESECDRLRHKVSLKEAEVRDLRTKMQQMERWVQATKHATQKRNARARAAERSSSKSKPVRTHGSHASSSNPRSSSAASDGMVQKTQSEKPQRKDTEDSIRDDVSGTGEDAKESPVKKVEEWQGTIARQNEVVKGLKAKIQEAQEQLNRLIVRRKSMETGLFVSESEVLKQRELAKKAEERATQLANELKRVYQDLPKVMEKRISVVSNTSSLEIKKKQLERLIRDNREEHFKFLDNTALALENEGIENRIVHLSTFVEKVEEFMQSNRDVAKSLEKRAQEARDSMGFLQQVWTKMVKRALEVQTAPVAGTEDLDEGPELLLYRAGSGLDQCLDILSKQGKMDLDVTESSRSPSPQASQTLVHSSTSPTMGSNKKLGSSGSFGATQSTRIPSPSPSSPSKSLMATSASMKI